MNPPALRPPWPAAWRVRLGAAAGLLLGGLLLAAGIAMLIAGLARYQASAFLQDWRGKHQDPAPRAWSIARQAAERAIAWRPARDGGYLQRLGDVYLWRYYHQPFGAPHAQADRLAARDAYRAAIRARPTWPYAHAALANAKVHLLEFDAEFHQALADARRLGPWRPELNWQLTEIGFIAWPRLDAAEREATFEAARRWTRMAGRDSRPLVQLARATGRFEALCAAFDAPLIQQGKLPCDAVRP